MASVNISSFFGGGSSSSSGGSGCLIQLPFTTSGTFVIPFDGDYLITGIGGGGGSKYVAGVYSSGGAGGLAQSKVTLAAGVSITYVVGAGGSGADGGTTTVTIPGYTTLTSNGGTCASLVGVGGTASGGNVMNVTGGSAGLGFGSYRNGGAVGVFGFTPSPGMGCLNKDISAGGYFNSGRILTPGGGVRVSSTADAGPGDVGEPGMHGGAFAGGGGSTIACAPGGVYGGGGGSAQGGIALGGVGAVFIEYLAL